MSLNTVHQVTYIKENVRIGQMRPAQTDEGTQAKYTPVLFGTASKMKSFQFNTRVDKLTWNASKVSDNCSYNIGHLYTLSDLIIDSK